MFLNRSDPELEVIILIEPNLVKNIGTLTLMLWIRNDLVRIQILLFRSFQFRIRILPYKTGNKITDKFNVYIMGLLQDFSSISKIF
jgi:hypothetical protein